MNELRGFHVTCDGRATAARALQWTEQDALDWCSAVIATIGMTCIHGPEAYQHQGKIMGIAVIAESHLAVHLVPEDAMCYAECFSCKPFDIGRFVGATFDAFGLSAGGAVRWRQRSVEETTAP